MLNYQHPLTKNKASDQTCCMVLFKKIKLEKLDMAFTDL